MAIELNFVKSDNETWGFRLTGGAEYDVPLTVIKVAENSIAERGGLRENDIIVRVNNTPTTCLSHPEAHDLLIAAGNNLILAIRRDLIDLKSPLTFEEENNEEITNIMQSSEENEEQFERQVHFEIVNPEIQQAQVTTEKESNISTERKWSTFLQKPTNPRPVKKEEVVPNVEPYRVIIKKQKKKGKEEEKKAVMAPEYEELDSEEFENIEKENSENIEEENVSTIQEDSVRAEITEEEEIQIEDNGEVEKVEEEEEQVEKNAELEKLLEEKLVEVQKQLQALAQLPSTIQSTIDAVTKQLATIVHISRSSVAESEDKEMSEVNSEVDNDIAEQTVTEEGCVTPIQDQTEADTEEKEFEEQLEESVVKEETVEEQAAPDLTEEEKEAKRLEQEYFEKQQKEREMFEEFKQRRLKQKPTLPLKPIERPIILPGGRRWSQPDDACPSVRNPKMTDEKIANTIETYSEVIVGKTKGINFLKYQPPPKNLDYLQRSDVYKLVHDLEPPVRGISSRVSKILAEQDYYQAG